MAESVFVLPDLGEGLEEAVVTTWLVAEGDTVALNQPFVEIETAKATVEVPAPFAGVVSKLHVSEGETLPVGAPLATFEVKGGGGAPGAGAQPGTATPAVRKHAKDLGVDLGNVIGTGPSGRATREDVERAAADAGADDDVRHLSPVRRTIARNLEEVARIPQVTTFRTLDCTHLEAFRRELGTSPLPVFVRALAEIARARPEINASWSNDGIHVHRSVHVGIATDTERGLVVPVVHDVETLGIASIAEEIARLAEAARSNALGPGDVSGATIAVSNTGSYGSEAGTPMLNPGHVVTIALGVIEPRALVVDGVVEPRLACTLSLTFDHRALDGATVGRALGALVDVLESRDRLEALQR